MFKRLCLYSTLLAAATGSVFATSHPRPGSWVFDAEYLYLNPSMDDTFFALDAPLIGGGTKYNNDFNFHSGFRVGAIWALCNCNTELEVYYSYLKSHDSRTIDGTLLSPVVGGPLFVTAVGLFAGTATSDLNDLYQRGDFFVSTSVAPNCCVDFRVLAGVEFAYHRINENFTYTTVGGVELGNFFHRSRIKGAGPQLGFEVDFPLWTMSSCYPGTLSLDFVSTASLLASRSEERSSATTVAGVLLLDVADNRAWRVIPAFHNRVGLNYSTWFDCFGVSLEIGYQIDTYVRAITREIMDPVVTTPGTIGAATTNYLNYSLQGLYVAGNVTF